MSIWAGSQQNHRNKRLRSGRAALIAACPATDSKAGNQIFKNNTSSHNATRLRSPLQHYLIPQSTARLRIFWVVVV